MKFESSSYEMASPAGVTSTRDVQEAAECTRDK